MFIFFRPRKSANPLYPKPNETKDLLRLSSTDTGVKHKQSLDIERVRSQRAPVKDCITCLKRFVACCNDCHQQPGCVLVDVPNYMEPDSLCDDAKIIKALCGGGQPTPRSCVVTLRAAYEKLKELFERE